MLVDNFSSIQLSQLGYGGAWNAALRINEALLAVGVNSEAEHEIGIDGSHSSQLSRMSSKIDFEIQRLSGANITTSVLRGSGNHSWYKGLMQKYNQTDIWNLHWIPGLPNRELANVIEKRNVVWTIHDTNPFTGVCHNTMTCNNFKSRCELCPQMINLLEFLPRLILEKKKSLLNSARNLTFVAPSKWIKEEFQESSIGADQEIHHIPNPIPNLFFGDKTAVLNKKKTVTLLGSNYSVSKNAELSAIALRQFLEKNLDTNIEIQIIGEKFQSLETFSQKCLPPGSSHEETADFLKRSDLFIYTSKFDNLPNLVLEAQAAGNVVIAHKEGGISECFIDGKTGIAVRSDPAAITQAIEEILLNTNLLRIMQGFAIDFVRDNYGVIQIGTKYMQLYENILLREKNI
jgi:glycosyltransferase involved in cell wall biosynthesis